MAQGELDHLRESCSFSDGIQIRLPEAHETIVSTCPSKVAFCEAAFRLAFVFLSIQPLGEYYITITSAPPNLPPMHGEVSSTQW